MNLETIRDNPRNEVVRFSIPAIISMVMTSLINVADGFFLGHYVGKEGMAAVSLGLPIIYLFLAVGLTCSAGGSAIAGMEFGAGRRKECAEVFSQTMTTVLFLAVSLSLVLYPCLSPLAHVFRAEGETAMFFDAYYRVLLCELPIMIINSALGMFVRGEGHPRYYMMASSVSVVLNIVLDYLFSKYLRWGVKGIAFASLISAAVAFAFLLFFFLKRAEVFRFVKFSFDARILRDSLLNGLSEGIGEMSMCISMFAYNYVIMRKVGVDGVTAFTIVGYVSFVFSMVILGFGQGEFPLSSFCYGAGDKGLAGKVRKETNKLVFLVGACTLVVMGILSPWYSSLFVRNEEVVSMVRGGMLIFMVSFLFEPVNVVTSFFFTSIGKAKESAIISSLRGFVLLLACICFLPLFLGMNGIWLAAPVTEGLTFLVSLRFIGKEDAKG